MATTTGGSHQKAPLQAEYGRASSAPAQTGEVRLAIAVHFVRAVPVPPMPKIGIASGFAQEEQ